MVNMVINKPHTQMDLPSEVQRVHCDGLLEVEEQMEEEEGEEVVEVPDDV